MDQMCRGHGGGGAGGGAVGDSCRGGVRHEEVGPGMKKRGHACRASSVAPYHIAIGDQHCHWDKLSTSV